MANINARHGYGQFDDNNYLQEGLGPLKDIYQRWIQDTKNKLLNTKPGADYIVPPINHAVWLVSETNPIELKELYIKKYSNTCKRLYVEDNNFKFYLWTNNPEIIVPKEIREIPNFEVRTMDEFKSDILWSYFEKLLKQSQGDSTVFPQASDVARVMILKRDGGIYADLDHETLNAGPLIQYMKSYHYINGKEHDFWDATIGNAFSATVKNHPILREEAKFIQRNFDETETLPLYLKYPYRRFDEVIGKTGPGKTTMSVYKVMFSNETYVDESANQIAYNNIILPHFVLYNMDLVVELEKKIYNFPPTKKWEGIELSIVGGDMFFGNWANCTKYQEIIDYNYNEQYYADHNIPKNNRVNFNDDLSVNSTVNTKPTSTLPRSFAELIQALDAKIGNPEVPQTALTIAHSVLETIQSIDSKIGDMSPISATLSGNTIPSSKIINALIATEDLYKSTKLEYLDEKIENLAEKSEEEDGSNNELKVDTPVSSAISCYSDQAIFYSAMLTIGVALMNNFLIFD